MSGKKKKSPPGVTDFIGGRGESICYVRLSDFCGNPVPYFRPHILGEKFPTLDFIVELVKAHTKTPYFFVQVKSTQQGCTKKAPARLKVSVSKRDAERLILYPAPTYIVGIDEKAEKAYIVAANAKIKGGMSRMPTTYPLDAGNLKKLWDEVKDYWMARDMAQKK